MNIVIAMDSFKGSMSSAEAGNAAKEGILKIHPDAEVTVLPLADGGEGTIDAITLFLDGTICQMKVRGPLNDTVDSYYLFVPSQETAYIEMAKASGLTLISPDERNPYEATTYGTGELIKDAISSGAKKIYVFMGGSATNDGGAGMLQALGCRLLDKNGDDIKSGAIGLKDLDSIDRTGLMGLDVEFIAATDVTNPLCGTNGASHVYGPQKGATPEMVRQMDSRLMSFAKTAGHDPDEPGTGAAGGLSFALKNFLGAKIVSGADLVTKITGLEEQIKDADIVITGEGKMDSQTLNGKAPFKVLQLAKRYGKTVYGITGTLSEDTDRLLQAGFTRIIPLKDPSMETDKAVRSVSMTLKDLFENI
ncbi:MAG: glycerate kinase [Clostridiales bacterium]|nr:glycerate kinase [Clostridiales bacterium]